MTSWVNHKALARLLHSLTPTFLSNSVLSVQGRCGLGPAVKWQSWWMTRHAWIHWPDQEKHTLHQLNLKNTKRVWECCESRSTVWDQSDQTTDDVLSNAALCWSLTTTKTLTSHLKTQPTLGFLVQCLWTLWPQWPEEESNSLKCN